MGDPRKGCRHQSLAKRPAVGAAEERSDTEGDRPAAEAAVVPAAEALAAGVPVGRLEWEPAGTAAEEPAAGALAGTAVAVPAVVVAVVVLVMDPPKTFSHCQVVAS